MKNKTNLLLSFPSFIFFIIILVLYLDSSIILKNNYGSINNILYLLLSFILVFLFWKINYIYYHSY